MPGLKSAAFDQLAQALREQLAATGPHRAVYLNRGGELGPESSCQRRLVGDQTPARLTHRLKQSTETSCGEPV